MINFNTIVDSYNLGQILVSRSGLYFVVQEFKRDNSIIYIEEYKLVEVVKEKDIAFTIANKYNSENHDKATTFCVVAWIRNKWNFLL
jgi:hypothetical protein